MSVTLALVVGGLTSVGVYLITSRSLTRMLLGFALLGTQPCWRCSPPAVRPASAPFG